MAESGFSPRFDRAVELAREGRADQGVALLRHAVETAVSQEGDGSAAHGEALNELGAFLLTANEPEEAVAVFREAVALPADGKGQRAHLDRMLSLGYALQQAGDFAEAEEVLRRCVAEREAAFGREDPAYALALEPLAVTLLRTGRPAESLSLLNEAARILWNEGHLRIAGVIAWRAVTLKIAGDATPPFAGLESLPTGTIAEAAAETLEDLTILRPPAAVRRAVQNELYYLVTTRLGPDHPVLLSLLAAIANGEAAEGAAGNHKARQQAVRQSFEIYERQDKAAEAVQALLGLALAQGDAGEWEAGSETYRAAAARAELLDDSLLSQVRRNHGLHLIEAGDLEGAERELRGAVAAGESARDEEMRGRAQAALGLLLRTLGREAEAAAPLADALSALDSLDADALRARAALSPGGSAEAFAEAVRAFLSARLPDADLLESVTVAPAGDVQVTLARESSDEETAAVQDAVAEAQRRLAPFLPSPEPEPGKST